MARNVLVLGYRPSWNLWLYSKYLTVRKTSPNPSPGNPEFAFWTGVALASQRREDAAIPLLREAFANGEGWRDLLRRLPAAGMLPSDDALIERLCGES